MRGRGRGCTSQEGAGDRGAGREDATSQCAVRSLHSLSVTGLGSQPGTRMYWGVRSCQGTWASVFRGGCHSLRGKKKSQRSERPGPAGPPRTCSWRPGSWPVPWITAGPAAHEEGTTSAKTRCRTSLGMCQRREVHWPRDRRGSARIPLEPRTQQTLEAVMRTVGSLYDHWWPLRVPAEDGV